MKLNHCNHADVINGGEKQPVTPLDLTNITSKDYTSKPLDNEKEKEQQSLMSSSASGDSNMRSYLYSRHVSVVILIQKNYIHAHTSLARSLLHHPRNLL